MREVIKILFVGLLFLILAACGNTAKNLQQQTVNERTDVFTELRNGDMPEPDFAVLIVRASIKKHVEGYYALESQDSGKSGYPFLLHIAGQTMIWRVNGQKDIQPIHNQDGKASRDPDAGEGIKYNLEKKIRIRTGTYKVFFGLPDENYDREVEIPIQNGKTYILEFKPVYKYKTKPIRIHNFLKGIKEFKVDLDGKSI